MISRNSLFFCLRPMCASTQLGGGGDHNHILFSNHGKRKDHIGVSRIFHVVQETGLTYRLVDLRGI